MRRYVWQRPEWPSFRWEPASLMAALDRARLAQGRLFGKVAGLGFELSLAERARVLVEETTRTAAIEGEVIDPSAVRSSVGRRLGLDLGERRRVPRHVDGLLDVLFDATERHAEPLTAERLQAWHASLFPTGRSGLYDVAAGRFRTADTPMQVVSGPMGRERVHFEAPPADRVAREVDAFLSWFADRSVEGHGLVRAAVAHFWFVTIHPFEDGNGRLARAVGEMALAQDEGQGERFYSLSAQIESERDAYYGALEAAQRGRGELTAWIEWFLAGLERALRRSEAEVDLAVAQSRFWQSHAGKSLNDRQQKVLRRVLAEKPCAFEGGITNRKVAHLTRVSSATAQRDLADLVAKGVIARNPGRGRSVSYRLVGYEIP